MGSMSGPPAAKAAPNGPAPTRMSIQPVPYKNTGPMLPTPVGPQPYRNAVDARTAKPYNPNQPIPVMPQPPTNPYMPPVLPGPYKNTGPIKPTPEKPPAPYQPKPIKIDPGTGRNVFNQASDWLDQSALATRQAMAYQPRSLAETNLNPYMNPFTQSVIDTSMADMNRGRQMAINDNGAAATRAGAFGNSRHGLVEAETNRGFADEVGQLTAGLNKENYYQAQQGALGDIGREIDQNALKLSGAGQLSGLSGQAFGYGQTLTDNMMRQGELQRDVQQQIIDAGKQRWDQQMAAPQNALQLLLASLGQSKFPSTSESSKQPGWLDLIKNFI